MKRLTILALGLSAAVALAPNAFAWGAYHGGFGGGAYHGAWGGGAWHSGAFGTTGVHYGPSGATAYHSAAYGTSAYHTGAYGTGTYHSGAYGTYGYHYGGGAYMAAPTTMAAPTMAGRRSSPRSTRGGVPPQLARRLAPPLPPPALPPPLTQRQPRIIIRRPTTSQTRCSPHRAQRHKCGPARRRS
jgi:hypothetical protein